MRTRSPLLMFKLEIFAGCDWHRATQNAPHRPERTFDKVLRLRPATGLHQRCVAVRASYEATLAQPRGR